MATHLEPSNHLANQKQGAANKHDLTVIIRLIQGSSRGPKDVHFSRVTAVLSESTGFNCCTSSKISCAGPQIERRWKCS
jgi:hypothetical protein